MVSTKQQGFTIIEVILFVAISGLLMATLLVGWTTTLNTQRYRDSVNSLQSFLQQQYNLVYNVENGRTGAQLKCNSDGSISSTPAVFGPGGESRGRTNCVLLGRYVTITSTPTESKLTVSAITGNDLNSDEEAPPTDLEAITNANPNRVTSDIGLSEGELTVPWGAIVVADKAINPATPPQSMAIAIVRSPLTGTVHTYAQSVAAGSTPAVTSMLNATESQAKLCLDPGTVFSGVRTAVIIREKASSQSSIETSAAEDEC